MRVAERPVRVERQRPVTWDDRRSRVHAETVVRQVGIRVALQKARSRIQIGLRRRSAFGQRETLGIGHRRIIVHRSDRDRHGPNVGVVGRVTHCVLEAVGEVLAAVVRVAECPVRVERQRPVTWADCRSHVHAETVVRQVGIRVALQKAGSCVQIGLCRRSAFGQRETLGISHRRIIVHGSDGDRHRPDVRVVGRITYRVLEAVAEVLAAVVRVAECPVRVERQRTVTWAGCRSHVHR